MPSCAVRLPRRSRTCQSLGVSVRQSHQKGSRIWDVDSGRLLVGPLLGHSAAILGVSISPDGRYLATVSQDHDGRLWDARTGSRLQTLRGHFALIRNVAFSSDSRWVVTAGPGSAGVWDVHTGRALFFLNAHDQLTAAALSPARWRIVTGGLLGTVKTYDCRLCGGIDDLITVGRERLANLRH
jgi:WD40 repeat protein